MFAGIPAGYLQLGLSVNPSHHCVKQLLPIYEDSNKADIYLLLELCLILPLVQVGESTCAFVLDWGKGIYECISFQCTLSYKCPNCGCVLSWGGSH